MFPIKHQESRRLWYWNNYFQSSLDIELKHDKSDETRLNEKINSKQLFLNDYDIYRKDRELHGDKNFQGGSMIAVKKNLTATLSPDSCVACRPKLGTSELVICAFCNPLHRKCISLRSGKFPTIPEKTSIEQADYSLWWPDFPRKQLEDNQQF